jgi:hypothetical protein
MGWRDIASAPKDGTRVLLATAEGVWLSRWRQQQIIENGFIRFEAAEWVDATPYGEPTHWMPLPELPNG